MDVIASFKGIFSLSQIFGVFPFGLKLSDGVFVIMESRGRLLCTRCVLMVYLFAQVFLLWHQLSIETGLFPEKSIRAIYVLGSFTSALSSAAMFRALIVNKTSFGFWLSRINKMFSNLTSGDLKKLKTYIVISLSVTAAFLVFSFLYELFTLCFYENSPDVSRTFLNRIYFAVFLFYLSVWHMKLFMQLFLLFVNLLRLSYGETRKTMSAHASKRQKRFWLRALLLLRVNDLVLKDFLDFLHYFFIPVASFQLLWGFANLVLTSMIPAKAGIPIPMKLGWVIYLSFDIYILVATCQAAESESEKLPHHLHEILINWDDEDISNEVEICSLQLQHKKIQFTAFGLHKINFTLLYAMIGSITSSAIIIIQFRHENVVRDQCQELLKNLTSNLENQIPGRGSIPETL